MAGALHHVALTAIDLEASRCWYDACLSVIGYQPGTVDPRICTWGGITPEVLLYPVEGADREPHTHGRPGLQHLAIEVDDRGIVDAAHSAVVQIATGRVVHPPQEYDYLPSYYAVFVEDPSGNRWEILTTTSAAT
ncbi:VOC family protein [Actinoplanes sp. L3-i22]|uniref:VOC family protein n=1 Tax=Actinoplanes sp. L3-i22 TaxID=2836373 RepID=UPI001C790378|nr:VOC family protein [Actinoplanes sp. L3-i22]BCY11044.1 hypothetical protein L3i22_061320 [Actinoplanes sp. L3-i22]